MRIEENTCQLIETNDYVTCAYGTMYYFRCNRCGYNELLDDLNYCANCGRKIVYERG